MNQSLPIAKADELVKLTDANAKESYEIMASLPDSEQWDMQPKLRHEAVDMVTNIGEGCGSWDPRDAAWRLSQARGNLSALLSLTKLAHQTASIKLNPDYTLRVKMAIATIDEEIPSLPSKAKVWMATNYPTSPEEGKS